jgi:mycoredoxin
MITMYGADWCEDTRRSRRLLRRLHMPYRYVNVDEDVDGLERARALNKGERRTPTIDLGLGAAPLVEPDNDLLTAALVEHEMLSRGDADERLALQNVGDLERLGRTAASVALWRLGATAPRVIRRPLRLVAMAVAATGVSGWCPVYHAAHLTSLDGPGDRPDEAERRAWLAPRHPPAHNPSNREVS